MSKTDDKGNAFEEIVAKPPVVCDLKNLGKRIKTARENRGLTQSELVDTSGGITYVSRWEHGDVFPRLELFCKVCEVLNITPNQLLGVEPFEEEEVGLKAGRKIRPIREKWLSENQVWKLQEECKGLPDESIQYLIAVAKRERKMLELSGELSSTAEKEQTK